MTENRQTVMHLIATNFLGGPEKQILQHLRRLSKPNYRGVLASFLERRERNETLEAADQAGIEQFGIQMQGPLDVRAQWKLTRLLRREQVDLLCVHGFKSCVMGWWSGLRAAVPVVGFSRGYTAEDRKVAFYESLERRALQRMEGIIFVAAGQREKLAAMGVTAVNSWVVHNAVSTEEVPGAGSAALRQTVRERFGVPPEAKMVVAAGRLSPEKGHRFLVEAAAALGDDGQQACFVFCGDGVCQAALEEQAQSLGISDRCRFPGFQRDMQEIFSVMDLMVLPSLTEGLPNVVLEAFACAKPVVATRVGGVPEVVEDGSNGLLVPPEQPEALAGAIASLLSSEERAAKMGRSGYRKVKQEFTFDAQTAKLEGIYQQLLGGAD